MLNFSHLTLCKGRLSTWTQVLHTIFYVYSMKINPPVSGPVQFRPLLFKGQRYSASSPRKWGPETLAYLWGYGVSPFSSLHPYFPFALSLAPFPAAVANDTTCSLTSAGLPAWNPSLLHVTVPPPLLETQFSITAALYTQWALLWSRTVPHVLLYRGAHHSKNQCCNCTAILSSLIRLESPCE